MSVSAVSATAVTSGGNHPLSPAPSRRDPTPQSTSTFPRVTLTPIRSATRSTVNTVPITGDGHVARVHRKRPLRPRRDVEVAATAREIIATRLGASSRTTSALD